GVPAAITSVGLEARLAAPVVARARHRRAESGRRHAGALSASASALSASASAPL
ncbi:MAG: hypothetical protein JWP18_1329, partial [Solirubrobacterales bacterium]|nr:hypothetical protein [Solirubrobacterales bacterium]